MAANRNEQVDKFVRGICRYISHLFETGTIAAFSEEEYVPSEPLTILFNRCINIHKSHLESHSYEYTFLEDRINILETMLKSRLEEAAQNLAPLDFLTKCTTYIIAGSYLKQHGFIEAPGIMYDAIYEAFVDSLQHHYLDQWFYVEKLKPPVVCTISNAMGIKGIDRVDKFVRGICKYVSYVYENDTVPAYNEKEYAPSESLRILLDRCINYYKNYLKVRTYDYVSQDDRIGILLAKYISSLNEAAELLDHFDFLTQCVSYIIAGSCLKQRGFLEAPDIACVAIYQAFVHSEQYTYLKPWFYVGETQNFN